MGAIDIEYGWLSVTFLQADLCQFVCDCFCFAIYWLFVVRTKYQNIARNGAFIKKSWWCLLGGLAQVLSTTASWSLEHWSRRMSTVSTYIDISVPILLDDNVWPHFAKVTMEKLQQVKLSITHHTRRERCRHLFHWSWLKLACSLGNQNRLEIQVMGFTLWDSSATF